MDMAHKFENDGKDLLGSLLMEESLDALPFVQQAYDATSVTVGVVWHGDDVSFGQTPECLRFIARLLWGKNIMQK